MIEAVRLPEIEWICHVRAYVPGKMGVMPTLNTVELVLKASTMDEAKQAANCKVLDLGYTVHSVMAAVFQKAGSGEMSAIKITPVGPRDTQSAGSYMLRNERPRPGSSSTLPAVVEKAPDPEEYDILKDGKFFSLPKDRPLYGRTITHDSCP